MNETDEGRMALQRLVSYWQARPQAADTMEGILQWWMGGTPVSRLALAEALEWLVERGVVTATLAADGRVRYRLSDPSGDALKDL